MENLRRNIEGFNRIERDLLEIGESGHALMYDGELVRVFPDRASARIEAARRYPDDDRAGISPAIGSLPASLGAIGLQVGS